MGCGGSKEQATEVAESAPPAVSAEVDWKKVHSAVRWNNIADCKKLITSEEAANCRDIGNGNYPIHIAAQNGHFEIVEMLLKLKATIDGKNAKGNTALHMSIGYDYYAVSKCLIDAGADVNALNDGGFAACKGIDGDKTLGLACLASAGDDTTLALHALNLVEKEAKDGAFDSNKQKYKGDIGKASLALKKKLKETNIGWTDEMQTKFKSILEML